MYKILHIHTDAKFIQSSENCISNITHNEVLFIGNRTESSINILDKSGFEYKIIENKKENIFLMVAYANKFDGVFFYELDIIKTEILFHLNSNIKTFLRFFGAELYRLRAKDFLSDLTLKYQSESKLSFINTLKRKLKIILDKEYFVQLDNQKKVYQKFDAVMMLSKFEFDELSKFFYLPKFIEIGLTNHQNANHQLNINAQKLNKIIIGNSGHRWNNHIDVLNIIGNSQNKRNIEFNLFFSYGAESVYSKKVKSLAQKNKNVSLIEDFLDKEKFEKIYTQAAALVINSYRQHAIGNIITAIKYGCKIYLNKKSSTFHWLSSKKILVSEVDNLKSDIESGNIKLSVEEQQYNIDCFKKALKDYSVEDFVNNVIEVLKN